MSDNELQRERTGAKPATDATTTQARATPFELALLAAILSLRNGSQSAPEECLADAQSLPNAAEKVSKGRLMEAITDVLDFPNLTFDQLLSPLNKSQGKKPRTLLGNITTHKGLCTAIRRCFSPEQAKIIIANKRVRRSQLEAIRMDIRKREHSRRPKDHTLED